MTKASLLYLASFAAHGALAAGVVSIKGARIHETVSVAVIEDNAKKKEKPPPPPPPPEENKAEKPKAKVQAARVEAPKPKTEAPPPVNPAPAAVGADVPDFGLTLGGGSASGGLAVPQARTASAPVASAAPSVTKKVLAAAVPATDACSDPPKKPKVVSIAQPSYTTQAREANIAGKVRIEVTVDKTGHVSSARVLDGLGYGLDEAALAAARAATFEPGSKCGTPSIATFVIAIRFAL